MPLAPFDRRKNITQITRVPQPLIPLLIFMHYQLFAIFVLSPNHLESLAERLNLLLLDGLFQNRLTILAPPVSSLVDVETKVLKATARLLVSRQAREWLLHDLVTAVAPRGRLEHLLYALCLRLFYH